MKGPTKQRNVTLPVHLWDLLDELAELESEAYTLMGGKTRYTVSDLLESGAELHIRSVVEDLGPLPKTPEQRKVFVKRLAELNQKLLAEDLLGKSAH